MRRRVLALGAVLLLGYAASAGAGGVGVPRDSPVVIHGRVQQSGSVDPSKVTPPQRSRQPARAPSSCRTGVFPDPGYRPLWVPETTCWTGFETVRVPGHWQGP